MHEVYISLGSNPIRNFDKLLVQCKTDYSYQRWSRGHQKKIRGQGHKRKCFPKKKVFKIFFRRSQKNNCLEKQFLADIQNFNHSKNSAILEPRTGQFSRT